MNRGTGFLVTSPLADGRGPQPLLPAQPPDPTFPDRDAGPLELVREVAATGKLPVVNFAAGGIATPADAALMMQLGVDGVFVGSGIYKSSDPATRARARSYCWREMVTVVTRQP